MSYNINSNLTNLYRSYFLTPTNTRSYPANTYVKNVNSPESNQSNTSTDSVLPGLSSVENFIDNFGKTDPLTGSLSGASLGAQVGSIIPGIGTAIGAIIGTLVGGVSSLFGSGKSIEQKKRDKIREWLQDQQIIDANWSLELADGSLYNIGIDGKNKLISLDGSARNQYDIDFENPLASQTVAWLNPVFEVLLAEDQDLKSQFVGYFTNAVMNNAADLETVKENILAIFEKFPFTSEDIFTGLVSLAESGQMDQTTLTIHLSNFEDLLSPSKALEESYV